MDRRKKPAHLRRLERTHQRSDQRRRSGCPFEFKGDHGTDIDAGILGQPLAGPLQLSTRCLAFRWRQHVGLRMPAIRSSFASPVSCFAHGL
jgi:hypothetical protein